MKKSLIHLKKEKKKLQCDPRVPFLKMEAEEWNNGIHGYGRTVLLSEKVACTIRPDMFF
jgi:hypothetical protein